MPKSSAVARLPFFFSALGFSLSFSSPPSAGAAAAAPEGAAGPFYDDAAAKVRDATDRIAASGERVMVVAQRDLDPASFDPGAELHLLAVERGPHHAATGADPVGRIVSQAVDPVDCTSITERNSPSSTNIGTPRLGTPKGRK